MIRIICSKCKNAYLKKEDGSLMCPSCEAVFPESAENLLSGAQYYNEGEFSQANDCLMKHIVKNGADPEAIFYKALCDGYSFDEDTASIKDVYNKLLEALSEIPDELFINYLALANDEAEKLEKLIADNHIRQFETADAEKIKKEVTSIINFSNEAKEFRNKLTELASAYNEKATNKISVKFSSCCLVQPEVASEVGSLKFERVKESIAAHTVFTGILSTDIKNLEIYYRCIVMFFEKDRQKYDFLMESAEKFTELAKLLEEGRYSSIKGVSSIANKLKSAAYDFFQESLKDHDDEFEQQTETVVVMAPETVEIPLEEATEASPADTTDAETAEDGDEYEDVYSSSETEENNKSEESAPEETADTAEKDESEQVTAEATEETITEIVIEEDDAEATPPEADEAKVVSEDTAEASEEVVEETSEEADDIISLEDVIAEQTKANEASEESVTEASDPDNSEDNSPVSTLEEIAQSGEADDSSEPDKAVFEKIEANAESTLVVKRKKSYGPFVAMFLIIIAVAGIIAVKVVPEKLNASNYEKAVNLASQKQYAQAADVFAELGDYSDAEEKALECRYNDALALEADKKFAEAKVIFASLGDYQDSAAKKDSCAYNDALTVLDNGNYDDAAEIFKTLGNYADSKNMIKECSYKKAISLIDKKEYEKAIELLETLGKYSDTKTKILEAKYGYATSNLDSKNETTLSYLKELARAEYKDSADLRNKLLGTVKEASVGVTSCINYSPANTKKNLKEVDRTKVIYFHVVVTDPELYNKTLTIDYVTSMGYHESKDIVLTEADNTYAFSYPSTSSTNYSVTFKLLSEDNATLTSQEVIIK